MNCILSCLQNVSGVSHIGRMRKFVQHGDTSCLLHSIAVAYYSLKLVNCFGVKCKKRELVRGALLHDYFLYDWHDGVKGRGLHGFTHPSASLQNADRDFILTDTERDIIKKHMFPLTVLPPKTREAWIVCLVDKLCSAYETVCRSAYTRQRTKSVSEYRELYSQIKQL